MSATAGRGPTMRDDETGTSGTTGTAGSTTAPPEPSRAVATGPHAADAGAADPSAAAPEHSHVVTEHDVRLALSSLGLEDRALTVHRATAFLTALGVTVTHAPLPATPWSADTEDAPVTVVDAAAAASLSAASLATVPVAVDDVAPTEPGARDLVRPERSAAPTARVTVRIPAGDRDDDTSVEGDIANLLEVLAHLQDHPPAPTPDELRTRPRVALPHVHPARPTVRAAVRRRSIA
ncbi:hypothetical protein [Cellulomonas fimi]|uniref:hypothetical protein n=1 Tax=Cellulomonas fimi TaxID=1708 RepID=UPI0023595C4D|nr:hypothetical protein [Cellulomonas fimi]